MHKYYLNNQELTKAQWKQQFEKHKDAKVVLRVDTLPATPEPEKEKNVITPQRAQALRAKYRRG